MEKTPSWETAKSHMKFPAVYGIQKDQQQVHKSLLLYRILGQFC